MNEELLTKFKSKNKMLERWKQAKITQKQYRLPEHAAT